MNHGYFAFWCILNKFSGPCGRLENQTRQRKLISHSADVLEICLSIRLVDLKNHSKSPGSMWCACPAESQTPSTAQCTGQSKELGRRTKMQGNTTPAELCRKFGKISSYQNTFPFSTFMKDKQIRQVNVGTQILLMHISAIK